MSIGLNSTEERIQVGGWGHHADTGGSYGITRDALRAVANDFERTGVPAKLLDRILAHLNLATPEALRIWLSAPRRTVEEVSG